MGLLKMLKKERPKKSLGVCVPEARKKALKEEAVGKPTASVGADSAFEVSGVFKVSESLILEGRVLEGMFKPGMEVRVGENKLKVSEITVNRKPAEKIETGEKGALFFNSRVAPNIKAGDVLEF